MKWTCITCEQSTEEELFDLSERQCFDCIEEDWELYSDERDDEEREHYEEHTHVDADNF